MVDEKALERQPWFFGFLSRREVFRHLLQVGDWCVRNTVTKGHEESILVVFADDKKPREIAIKNLKNGDQSAYGFANSVKTVFPTIADLIDHLKNNLVLPKGIKLLHAVQRPDVMLREDQVEVDKKKLGQGNYAEVVKGFFIEKDGKKTPVAIKQSKTDVLNDFGKLEKDEQKRTLRKMKILMDQMTTEARLLKGTNHGNVIKIYGISCDKLPIQVVVEFCPGGSLLDHIQHMKDKITTEELNIFLLEIGRGLRHLQLSKILHRDVAARNCLIGSKGQIVIADFGLSKPYEELKEDEEGIQMAMPWMAPETLSRTPRFSVKSDVYSYGVVINELYTFGEKPWPDLDVDSIIPVVRSGKKMKPPDNMAENIRNLMNECWNRKPIDRPDFVGVVRKLRPIVEEGKIPELAARSVAHIEHLHVAPFHLHDETDLEIVEYSCISEDKEEDSSSRKSKPFKLHEKRSDKGAREDSSGSTRRRRSQRKRNFPAQIDSNNGSDPDNNHDNNTKEEEEPESSTPAKRGSTRKRTSRKTIDCALSSSRGSTPANKNTGVQKRQVGSANSTSRKAGVHQRRSAGKGENKGSKKLTASPRMK
ncbi:hypothetical protein L596_020323 [Steinernema carpocapsae]|uniref:Tyrosine-protein kinase n=1 Tax=Steinernema carpocapsae TaxID=34508 RepID=A0A4U5MTZ1_STECR|nr:hypothetical protein L596_020323 [Steinernema carpocapsae]